MELLRWRGIEVLLIGVLTAVLPVADVFEDALEYCTDVHLPDIDVIANHSEKMRPALERWTYIDCGILS